MKYAFIMTLAVLACAATGSLAQTPANPASETVPGVPSSSPACAVAQQETVSPCSVNATSPECLGAQKTYVSCMAGFDAANGKGPCAEQNKLMLQYCTADGSTQQCRNARVSYNSCIENPPGYPATTP